MKIEKRRDGKRREGNLKRRYRQKKEDEGIQEKWLRTGSKEKRKKTDFYESFKRQMHSNGNRFIKKLKSTENANKSKKEEATVK